MSWLNFLFGKPKETPTPDHRTDARLRQEAAWQRLLDTCPFPLAQVPAAQAAAAWLEARAAGTAAGSCPLILTVRTPDLGAVKEAAAIARIDIPEPDEIVQILAEKAGHDADSALPPPLGEIAERPAPEAPPRLELASLSLPLGRSRAFPQAAIARIPVSESWQIPLILDFGGWNAAPEPAEMAAFARRWKALYGAEIACISEDSLEFAVERPPSSFEDAKRLAFEHTLFCQEDLGDMDDYVASLRTARSWFFWWD
ncbi:DUF4253 domain-containing protein [Xanthobacter autotrophicus DSM 431]|uniref:DUF4253 domain-containing protein n=1 Tax=Xanthobacter nonsaccharivorans TaxID=3119912 RepID=UPI003728487A